MEIEKIPFKDFFEESIKTICEHDPTALAMAVLLEDGQIFTGYCNAEIADKAVMANAIQQDAMMDMIRANIGEIAGLLKENEEEEDGL